MVLYISARKEPPMQKTLIELVSEFVDDQIGLDCASCCTTFNDTNISIFSKGSMSEGEWEEMAGQLPHPQGAASQFLAFG
jgi:hypothetical protein